MKKIVKIVDIDCANCATKLENALAKIDGVDSVNINYIAEKMLIEIKDEDYDAIVKQINKVTKKVEPDCRIIGL